MAEDVGVLPKLILDSHDPYALTVLKDGKSYRLSVPQDFAHELEDIYDSVALKDLTGDGMDEVIFHLEGGGVNACSRVLSYSNDDHSLKELLFKGGSLCNFKLKDGHVISFYRDRGAWSEDVYSFKSGKANILISDRCIGCGQVQREQYLSNGSMVRSLVTDDPDVNKRVPLLAYVVALKARIFSAPDSRQMTNKYLISGDEVELLDFHDTQGEDWIEFRFHGATTTEGWMRCGDIGGCFKPRPG